MKVGYFLSWPFRTLARTTADGFLFLALVILCGALSAGSNSWSNIPLLIALMLFALWLLSLGCGSSAVRSLALTHRHPEHVFAGESFNVSVQVENLSRLPVAGLLIEENVENEVPPSPPGLDGRGRSPIAVRVATGQTFVVSLAGKQQARANYTVTIRRRGACRFGASHIRTVFPLGFFRSESVRRLRGRIVVYPRMGEVDAAFFQDVEHALENMRRARPSRAEETFRGLREYRREDNPRWIHWRVSARAGELLVREFEEPLSKRVVLLLDTNLLRLGTRRFAALESAISFVASAAREFARRGIEVECAAMQPEGARRATVSRGRRNLAELLEMLALLRRCDSSTLDALRDELPRRSLHGAFVIVVGLGSLRVQSALKWLRTSDNVVRTVDVLGEDFGRIFRREARPSVREQAADEDMLLALDEEELETP